MQIAGRLLSDTFIKMQTPEPLILPSNLAAVKNALQQTFGSAVITECVLLAGGLSGSAVYKMAVNDEPYVLKLNSSSGCMEIAAEAGLAPSVYYLNKEAGLSITRYIKNTARPLIQELARLIRRIHELPAFPAGNNLVTTVDGFIAQFKGSTLADCRPYYAEIRKHYPWNDSERVPSHNDLNPGNILCDGEKIWVIDWDAAHQSDRYVDLAIAANFYVTGDKQEESFLITYFGDELTDYKRSRFFLMRQVCRIVYGILLFDKGTLCQTLLNNALTDMRSPRFVTSLTQLGFADKTGNFADISV